LLFPLLVAWQNAVSTASLSRYQNESKIAV
jgi:hypothetical protein